VLATLRGPLHTIFKARTMADFAFPLPEEWVRAHEDVGAAVVRALTSPEARVILGTWTIGYARFRLAWAGGGHKRAVVWRIAQEVAERTASEAWLEGTGGGPKLVNDPTESTWEARVEVTPRSVRVELTPRIDDPRFAYRTKDVPGASHPPLAAALARVGEARADDVVWDPFMGAGTELVERAVLGPYHEMYGSDLDERAIAAARANVRAAGVERVTLAVADALAWAPRGVSLIVTNPPMGRRVTRTADLVPMLERFVEHAGRVLPPGGRLVWVSPFPERTAAAGARAGLELQYAQAVDMGGFRAEIQRFVRGEKAPTRRRPSPGSKSPSGRGRA
jgi:predicted RNA methylase